LITALAPVAASATGRISMFMFPPPKAGVVPRLPPACNAGESRYTRGLAS
jgi:hypothetical protein